MHKSVVLFLILSSLCAYAFALPSVKSVKEQWKDFKITHRKAYSKIEELYRIKVFAKNLLLIEKYQAANPNAQFGVTKFSDLTPEEFKSMFLGLNKIPNTSENRNYYKPTITDIPASWDWKEKGAVTSVKNQGSCGSCWAFSAIQNIEGQNFLKSQNLTDLSEQQLIDCDKVDHACLGGWTHRAFQWLTDNGGVASAADYPYTAHHADCKFVPSMAAVQVTGYHNISQNETEIAQALVELGPLSIGVVADPWQFYWRGILGPWFCNGGINHGVLLVGYGNGWGIISKADYWLVKNSWGGSWGEKGYIRLERGLGTCEMHKYVNTATIA